jgi:ABC-type sugar transport system ATPase subunit
MLAAMSDPNPAAVAVRGLRKSFHHIQALRGIGFTAAPGCVTALPGSNGCGKTTATKIFSVLFPV